MNATQSKTLISGGQYSLFRGLFGTYLLVHFGFLLFYGTELFSNQGMLPSGSLSPLFNAAPSLLKLSDATWFVMSCLASGVIAAVGFAVGKFDKACAAWMLLLLSSVFVRNPLIANPALPYVGFMLLFHLFTPAAPYGSLAARGRPEPGGGWALPGHLFFAATLVLAISYSYSGYTKLLSPGWVSGETVGLVLENPLARDWFLRDLFLAVPSGLLQAITWFILIVELLFVPLFLIRRLRFGLWFGMLMVQFGFLALLRFPDLTIPMLLFHLLTFDPGWLRLKQQSGALLRYDGDCGVCHGAVRFALAELPVTNQVQDQWTFQPMQNDPNVDMNSVTSWELELQDGRTQTATDALITLLNSCGGSWRLLGLGLGLVPRTLRNWGYTQLAQHRRRLSRAPTTLCPLVSPELSERFI